VARLDRREFLLGTAATLAAGASASALPASKLARRRPGFGAAATLWDLQADPRLGEAISTYCTQVVPVLELKWPMLRPKRTHVCVRTRRRDPGFCAGETI
jgi:endo-1,4-beta-xylanase